MSVKIGKIYWIKFSAAQLMSPVDEHNTSEDLRNRYPLYVDLIDKPVVLTSVYHGYGQPGDPWYTPDRGVVTFKDGPSYWMQVDTDLLYEKPSLDICTCALSTLMCSGCKCGVMKKKNGKK